MTIKKSEYHIRAEHNKSGKVIEGPVHTRNIGYVIGLLGKYGYIVTDQHEVFDRVKG